MKLTSFTINNLWGNKNISIPLNEDVNIFAGINGSGKTTILNILYCALFNDPDHEICKSKYETAEIILTDGYRVNVECKEGKKEAQFFHNDSPISYETFAAEMEPFAVSSFDSNMYPMDVMSKLKERYPWLNSDLEYRLVDKLQDFYMYRNDITHKIEQVAFEKGTHMSQVRNFFQDVKDLRAIIDELFAPKLKWDEKASEVQFVLQENTNQIIHPKDLSSGEKQMLILAIDTLLQEKRECVVFWDEPELSMHVDWQKVLIKVMREINPHMQLILATHSPFIIYDGWENRVVNIQKMIK